MFTIGSVDSVFPGPGKTTFVWYYFAQGYVNTDMLVCFFGLKIPRMIRGEASTENTPVKDIRILLRYQYDDEVAGSRSLSICRSSANQRKEALWICVMRNLIYIGG